MNPRPRFSVRSDMEGLSGVVDYRQVTPGRPEYAETREILMAELLALIEGLRAGGAGEIVIYDEHVRGMNTDIARLPAGVSTICGKPPYRADWAGGLDESFSGMILLGLHARAGTANALLAHTYEHDIAEIRINDRVFGEIGVEAAIAGEFGVPLAMAIADSAGVAEAEALVPGVVGVAVKESREIDGGICLPLCESTRSIRDAAERVARGPIAAQPLRIAPPVRMRIDLRQGPYLEAVRALHGRRMVGDDCMELAGDSVLAVWAEYWKLKLMASARVSKNA